MGYFREYTDLAVIPTNVLYPDYTIFYEKKNRIISQVLKLHFRTIFPFYCTLYYFNVFNFIGLYW